MSAIKKIVILFNRDVELSELTKDFIKMSESGFFGLTGKYWKYNSKYLEEQESVPLGFINLNGTEYDLYATYYPEGTNNAIRMAAFENDWSDFHSDFIDYSSKDDNESENVKKLIGLLKNNLNYYSMTLFTYDYWTDCPHTDELLNMQLNGTLTDSDGKCYLFLDGL